MILISDVKQSTIFQVVHFFNCFKVQFLFKVSILLGIIPLMGSTVIESSDSHRNFTMCTVDTESKHTTFGFLLMPFKKFYDFIFLSCALIITFLYLLIYQKIYVSRKIKRKREILYSKLIRQAEIGIIQETMLLKENEDTAPKSSFLLKNCCLTPVSGKYKSI